MIRTYIDSPDEWNKHCDIFDKEYNTLYKATLSSSETSDGTRAAAHESIKMPPVTARHMWLMIGGTSLHSSYCLFAATDHEPLHTHNITIWSNKPETQALANMGVHREVFLPTLIKNKETTRTEIQSTLHAVINIHVIGYCKLTI